MFTSSHKLDFEVADWNPLPGFPPAKEFKRFRVGTCHGLWTVTEDSYDILAINNDKPGNGHLEDVLEWFEQSCKRDKRTLRVLEIMNRKFADHLVNKRGFTWERGDNLIKRF